MPAFIAAVEQGYDYIEADPAFTKDGQCIVFHDQTIKRTCRTADGSPITEDIAVAELTYKELLSYDAGIFMGEQFRGTSVPLLSELLEFSKKHHIPVKLDNKVQSFTEEQRERFFDIVNAAGAPAAITASNLEYFEVAAKRFSKATLHFDGLVNEENLIKVRKIAGDRELYVWISLDTPLTKWVQVPHASTELCSLIKKYAKLGIWILETDAEADEAKAFGADIIETTGSVKPKK